MDDMLSNMVKIWVADRKIWEAERKFFNSLHIKELVILANVFTEEEMDIIREEMKTPKKIIVAGDYHPPSYTLWEYGEKEIYEKEKNISGSVFVIEKDK